MMLHGAAHAAVLAAKICPKAPPGASQPINDITGYLMWGVIVLFGLGLLTGIGGVVGGRLVNMPHASKMSLVGIIVVFVSVIAYLILPAMLDGILGKGCI